MLRATAPPSPPREMHMFAQFLLDPLKLTGEPMAQSLAARQVLVVSVVSAPVLGALYLSPLHVPPNCAQAGGRRMKDGGGGRMRDERRGFGCWAEATVLWPLGRVLENKKWVEELGHPH